MKYYLFTFFIFFQFSFAQNENCNCHNELNYVIENVKDAPSFKSQLKNDEYQKKYINELISAIETDPNIELNCLAYLQKYLKIVKDSHIYIANRNTDEDNSLNFPKTENIEDLVDQYKLNTDDEITGIYTLLDIYKVLVIKNSHNTYKAILLETTNNKWNLGQTKFILKKTQNSIEGIFYNGMHQPQFVEIDYRNGRLYPEQWIKEDQKEYYTYDPYKMDDKKFKYEKLEDNLHYVRLGSFSGMTSNYNDAKLLLETLENNVLSGNVIVDLRNNGGGGPRTSDLFRKFFKKQSKTLNIFVIQNNNSGSDCEQFLVKLKNQQPVKTFGENTRGAIAYGFGNYSSPSLKTPCYGFSLGITSAKYENYLQYEVVGISPDVYLNFQEDWIYQVIKYIKN